VSGGITRSFGGQLGPSEGVLDLLDRRVKQLLDGSLRGRSSG
jgi:hypothetical protein